MTTKHLLDPELHPLLELVPAFELDDEQLPLIRNIPAMAAELADPALAGVTREEVHAAGGDGPEVRALMYKPPEAAATGAGYLHIHGGGYVMGTPESSDPVNLEICARLGVLVLSVDYRVAPEHPIPAPLDDCYTGLAWLHEQAPALGVDRNRIGIGGESAGGGLAAALAIKARDAGEYAICHQPPDLSHARRSHRHTRTARRPVGGRVHLDSEVQPVRLAQLSRRCAGRGTASASPP